MSKSGNFARIPKSTEYGLPHCISTTTYCTSNACGCDITKRVTRVDINEAFNPAVHYHPRSTSSTTTLYSTSRDFGCHTAKTSSVKANQKAEAFNPAVH